MFASSAASPAFASARLFTEFAGVSLLHRIGRALGAEAAIEIGLQQRLGVDDAGAHVEAVPAGRHARRRRDHAAEHVLYGLAALLCGAHHIRAAMEGEPAGGDACRQRHRVARALALR